MDIEKEIQAIVHAKTGNKEIAFFYDPDTEWTFSVGNPSIHVMLGEVGGETETRGKTMEEVITKMKGKLKI